MANLSRTKTLFAFTSPRTIEKIIPEIALLCSEFAGDLWNNQTQNKYFSRLFSSDFYQGNSMPRNPEFAARDRITRAPKALGFVDLKPVIALTRAGEVLLEGKRIDEIITRQLLKFQLPSPYHRDSSGRFCVRPYLELLRFIRDLGGLSKTELALFFLQLTHIKYYDMLIDKVKGFRKAAKTYRGSWGAYVAKCFENEIGIIYKEEIRSRAIRTRESDEASLSKFISTKRRNMLDYADAFIRYIHATQLVTFERHTFRLIVSPVRGDDVDFILENEGRRAIAFNDEESFKEYLFDPASVQLLSDDRTRLVNRLLAFGCTDVAGKEIEDLKNLLHECERRAQNESLRVYKQELKSYENLRDISDTFEKIKSRNVPDPPLFLEWNVWRAFVMLNYALRVDGNFTSDIHGMPLSVAPGKKADIEIEYKDFSVIVEVTMSSGETQFRMESESVPRHFGDARVRIEKDVYCIFVAPSISNGTLAYFFNLNRIPTYYYGGETKIIPMNLDMFVTFVEAGVDAHFSDSERLKDWLEFLWKKNQQISIDEVEWFRIIEESVASWALQANH